MRVSHSMTHRTLLLSPEYFLFRRDILFELELIY